ncbi:membrane protein insertase YidC [Corynebacterium aquatimens]|nr:membrane protein insertase YidC [Corynebacterium aquatimens]WJY66860.1 Membrane protein insertase YidC precursor [Corynebacterium aquatimens]
MSLFVFPVSAVMKFWHRLLSDVLGAAPDTAWVAAIILLVITIRSMIAPFSWTIMKSGRTALLMRPELKELEEQYRLSTTHEDVAAYDEARKDVQKKYGYNPIAGCVPPLIQIPAFLGLYRLLLWMSVPENGHTGGSIGLLTSDDVSSFLDTRFMGEPLPAYMAMTPEQFANLGTTAEQVGAVAVPLLICAIIFTTFNMVLGQIRTRATMDWEQGFARGVYRVVWGFAIAVPFMLIGVALTGRIPIALLLYWFCNNLWTLGQTIIMWIAVVKKYPLDDTHLTHLDTSRTTYLKQARERKATKRDWRRRRLAAVTTPQKAGHIRREIKAEKQSLKDTAAAAKAERKAAAKQQSKVRSELRKQTLEKQRAERAARREEKAREHTEQSAPKVVDKHEPEE